MNQCFTLHTLFTAGVHTTAEHDGANLVHLPGYVTHIRTAQIIMFETKTNVYDGIYSLYILPTAHLIKARVVISGRIRHIV
jgi:hypothetical protein